MGYSIAKVELFNERVEYWVLNEQYKRERAFRSKQECQEYINQQDKRLRSASVLEVIIDESKTR